MSKIRTIEIVGNNIESLRKQMGFSQQELADKVGKPRPSVSNWENAKSEPSSTDLVALAKIFGVSLDELTGNMKEQKKVVVVDTNILFNRPCLTDELVRQFDEVIVPEVVTSELNGIKDARKNRSQRAWLAMVNLTKWIDEGKVIHGKCNKKYVSINDDKIMQVAIERAQKSISDKVYMFSDDVYFNIHINSQKQLNLELLNFNLYDERFKESDDFDLIKTQEFFSMVKNRKLSSMKNIDLASVDINKTDSATGFTPLIQAVRNNDFDIVKFLMELPKIDPDAKDSDRYNFTALLHAAQLRERCFDIFKLLVELGADIETGGAGKNAGNTPLMVCAWGGFKKGVEFLLEQGACLNQQDKNGFTALTKACIKMRYDIAELLITHTDIKIRSRENKRIVEYVDPKHYKAPQFYKLFRSCEAEDND